VGQIFNLITFVEKSIVGVCAIWNCRSKKSICVTSVFLWGGGIWSLYKSRSI